MRSLHILRIRNNGIADIFNKATSSSNTLGIRDLIAKDFGYFLQRLAFGLGEDSEETYRSNGIAGNEDSVVSPADMNECFGRKLVKEKAGCRALECAN